MNLFRFTLEGRSEASDMAPEASADLSDFLTICLVISVLFAQENLFLVILHCRTQPLYLRYSIVIPTL